MPSEMLPKFSEWMRGQTMLFDEEHGSGVYLHDFDRWLEMGEKANQGPDWD